MENSPFLIFDNVIIYPSVPKPIEGYQVKKGFPNCCPFHKSYLTIVEEYSNKFPNNSPAYREFATNNNLNPKRYDDMADRLLNSLSYTEHHITTRINNSDWYKDITNYIDYIIWCLGSPSFGKFEYLHGLSHFISYHIVDDSPDDTIKRQRLLEYIEKIRNRGNVAAEEIDLNKLYNTYQKWIRLFPFKISQFNDLKAKFSNTLPILSTEPTHNPYTGLSTAKVFTKKELVAKLVSKTNDLLKSVNSSELVRQGLIHDYKAYKYDLELEAHRIRQEALLNHFSKKESRYVETINQWLINEKDFFKDIMPLLNANIGGVTSLPGEKDTRKNIFNSMSIVKAENWFEQLATEKSKNGNPFLTKTQVGQFINRAFLGEPFTEKLSINEKSGDKAKIIGLFYLFYSYCTSHIPMIGKIDKAGTVDKYIKLLTDHFDNWTFEEVKHNFRRGGNWEKRS